MTIEIMRTGLIGMLMLATTPVWLSAIGVLCYSIYSLSMLKINVVDKRFKGRWGLYFKSYITYFKKKQ